MEGLHESDMDEDPADYEAISTMTIDKSEMLDNFLDQILVENDIRSRRGSFSTVRDFNIESNEIPRLNSAFKVNLEFSDLSAAINLSRQNMS